MAGVRTVMAAAALAAMVVSPTADAQSKKKPPPLDGETIDYAYDAKDINKPERAWLGRAFVPKKAAGAPDKPLPILVFIHGLNTELIKHRWFGGGNEGDVRRIVGELVDSGTVPPMIVAAPSSILPVAVTVATTSWPAFDLDRFLDRTAKALEGVASIDRERVIVAGHSGGGCNDHGGMASAIHGRTRVHAALAIDTCMLPGFATQLAKTRPTTHVVVSWQMLSWQKRPIRDFRTAFERAVDRNKPEPGVLRELEQLTPTEAMPHDAMVPLVLKRWLPKLLSTS
jgi:hypothetical protein